MLALLVGLTGLAGCTDPTPVPRPRAFHRLDLPTQRQYVVYNNPSCPYQFEYPAEATPRPGQWGDDSCAFDLVFERYDAVWHFTLRNYAAEGASQDLSSERFRELVFEHAQKSTLIQPRQIETPQGQGTFYELYGQVPEPAAFHFGDGRRYGLMGVFYYNTALKNDSLEPVSAMLKADLEHLVHSIRWRP